MLIASVLLLLLHRGSGTQLLPGAKYHELVGVPLAERIRAAEDAWAQGRVVGGSEAPLGRYPYLAGVLVPLNNAGVFSVCGATLLTSTSLLTAAHCWFPSAPYMEVILGTVRLFYGGTRVRSSAVLVHPEYDHNLGNDVAIIITPQIKFTDNIKPLALPDSSEDQFAGYEARVVGFGAKSDNTGITMQQTVSEALVSILSNAACRAVYGNLVKGTVICSGGEGGRGPCGGDSGGPLAVRHRGRDVLVGVSSFVSATGCERSLPAGYSRVSEYLPWILSHITPN